MWHIIVLVRAKHICSPIIRIRKDRSCGSRAMVNHFQAEFIKQVIVLLTNSKVAQVLTPTPIPLHLPRIRERQNGVQESSAASTHTHS
jgi:hypothetical protein